MTRQLFPSPSQGALICAGGGEEGQLAAAPASVAARRQDPAPHRRLESRIRAFLRGFWTLLGILLLQTEQRLQRATEPASRRSELHSWGGGLGSPAVPLRRRSPLHPRRACVRGAAAGRRPSGEKEGGRIPPRRVGSRGSVYCRVGLFFVVFIPGTSKPLLRQARALKVPGRDRNVLLFLGPKPQGPVAVFRGVTRFPWTTTLVLQLAAGVGVPVSTAVWLSGVTLRAFTR